MKKLLLLTTGGTISSTQTEEGLAPNDSSHIIDHISRSFQSFSLDVNDIMTLDSTNIQPEEWKIIASSIYDAMGHYDGIVVTHGTDTMAYTASMMCFMIKNPSIPVVFTGSQVPISSPLSDALLNIRCAFTMALSGRAGVFVAFNRKVILGCRAVKVRTTAFDAFESVNLPYAGIIDAKGLHIQHEVIPRFSGSPELLDEIDANIFLLKLTPGTSPEIVDMLIDSGCHGIVIEAFGAGGVQFVRRDFISKLKRAQTHNIPVVVCSQCLYEPSDFSAYQVGRKALEAGVIEGFDMTSEAAVTKLMWALGQTRDLDEIRRLFKISISGEIGV